MKKTAFLILLMAAFAIASCTKDRDDELSLLGSWYETAPVAHRTQLLITTENHLTIIDGDGSKEEYSYRIGENTIILSLLDDPEVSVELLFSQIDQNKLKIESFYPKIPEAPLEFIIFERE